MTQPDHTRTRIADMTRPQIAAALRAGVSTADNSRRGAVEALAGYNAGDLLDAPGIRVYLAEPRSSGTDSLHVAWRDLAAGLADDAGTLARLPAPARGAALLACALAVGAPMPDLPRYVCEWGRANRRAMLHAFAAALGLDADGGPPATVPPGVADALGRPDSPGYVRMVEIITASGAAGITMREVFHILAEEGLDPGSVALLRAWQRTATARGAIRATDRRGRAYAPRPSPSAQDLDSVLLDLIRETGATGEFPGTLAVKAHHLGLDAAGKVNDILARLMAAGHVAEVDPTGDGRARRYVATRQTTTTPDGGTP